MNTIRRTKTEITVETIRVTMSRNSISAPDAVCGKCGQTMAPIEEIPALTFSDDVSRLLSLEGSHDTSGGTEKTK